MNSETHRQKQFTAKTITLPRLDPSTCPLPEAYYHDGSGGKDYLFRKSPEEDRFIRINTDSLKRQLKGLDYSVARSEAGTLSEMDVILNRIQTEQNVSYAGPLAGHRIGLYRFGNAQVLVTHSPKIIEPAAGDWSMVHALIENLLGEPQSTYFYGWLKVAFESLQSGKHRPGQALFLAGPARSGKSLLQKLISVVLGGPERTANPYDCMTGNDKFNSDLFGAEHLIIDDKPAIKTSRERQHFTDSLKEIVNPQAKRCHGKFKEALMLQPFWRLSISINDSDENLAGFLQLNEGSADKLMLFKTRFAEMPMPTFTDAERTAFFDQLVRELPGFLHAILSWEIPDEMRSPRFGVLHYHNDALLTSIAREQPEMRLMDIIDAVIFSEPRSDGNPWKGLAVELENYLRAMDYRSELQQLLTFSNACGTYLGRLADRLPHRVQHSRVKGVNRWKIFPPECANDEEAK